MALEKMAMLISGDPWISYLIPHTRLLPLNVTAAHRPVLPETNASQSFTFEVSSVKES